jgi:hypothetical protein
MKNEKSIYCLPGLGLMLAHNSGLDTLLVLRMRLASAVHFHTLFKMSINHVALRGLVNPDKEVMILRLEDDNGNPQEMVSITVHQVLPKYMVNNLPFWQGILQNNDGSWCGY